MKEHYHYFLLFYVVVNGNETYTNSLTKKSELVTGKIIRKWEDDHVEIFKKKYGGQVGVILKDFKEISCDCEE
jgi:hypothetical protein